MKKQNNSEIELEYEPIYWNPDDFSISFDELIARIKNKYGDEFDPSEKRAFNVSCRCSECGCKNNRQTNYCPACGKKMWISLDV